LKRSIRSERLSLILAGTVIPIRLAEELQRKYSSSRYLVWRRKVY